MLLHQLEGRSNQLLFILGAIGLIASIRSRYINSRHCGFSHIFEAIIPPHQSKQVVVMKHLSAHEQLKKSANNTLGSNVMRKNARWLGSSNNAVMIKNKLIPKWVRDEPPSGMPTYIYQWYSVCMLQVAILRTFATKRLSKWQSIGCTKKWIFLLLSLIYKVLLLLSLQSQPWSNLVCNLLKIVEPLPPQIKMFLLLDSKAHLTNKHND